MDVELVRRGLVSSRARAVEAIAAGRVLAAGAPVANAARQVTPGEALVVLAPEGETYVSRGGHKLEAALDAFTIDVQGRSALDVGASTGGFTDCLLRRGAARVLAVDVGHGQLDWKLRQDERVTVMERTNIRALATLPFPVDVCVVDVSFVSLRTIAAHLLALTEPATDFVLLVKPQYEAGRERVPRKGVVRDPAVHAAVLHEVVAGLDAAGLGVGAVVPSPIRGADGNVEFLAYARRGHASVAADALDDAVRRSQEAA